MGKSTKQSAGILGYRQRDGQELQVLLVHPGGPFYAKKDEGYWGIPKGEYEPGEEPIEVAKREFFEETGNSPQFENLHLLEPVRIKSGKVITAWAAEIDLEQPFIESNLFEMEWPPRSGKRQMFPECDAADWFDLEMALIKINEGQKPFIYQLANLLKRDIKL